MKQPVIYKIRNVVNDKFYVGSTKDTRERFRAHRNKLRKGVHHCPHLQAAWNKYGEDCFKFEVVEVVESADLLFAAENRWLEAHFGKPYCYNAGRRADAPMRGRTGAAHPQYGATRPEQVKTAVSASLKAFYAANPEQHPRLGKFHSDEVKAKISAAKLENPQRPWLGKPRSEETKAKLSAAQKGRANPRKGLPMSEQGRANVAAAVKRGEASHFYGKRPANADDLQKEVVATLPDGTIREFVSLSAMRDATGVNLPTIIRACKSGKVVSKGALSGWRIAYKTEPTPESSIPAEYAGMPRTRQLAKESGAKFYFTGEPCTHGHVAPRKLKGTCVECAKLEGKKANESKRKDIAYSHESGVPATLLAIYTDAAPAETSEWPTQLSYRGKRWGRHEVEVNVYWVPEDLETALGELMRAKNSGDPLHDYYWTAAETWFPAQVVNQLRALASALGVDSKGLR